MVPSVVFAWGSDGHHVIALIAETMLTLKTKTEVDRLLTLEPGGRLALHQFPEEHLYLRCGTRLLGWEPQAKTAPEGATGIVGAGLSWFAFALCGCQTC